MFLIRNIRFSAHFSRQRGHRHPPRRGFGANPWDSINSTSPQRDEDELRRSGGERVTDRGCRRHVLKSDPRLASKSTAKHYPASIFSWIVTPDVGVLPRGRKKLKFTSWETLRDCLRLRLIIPVEMFFLRRVLLNLIDINMRQKFKYNFLILLYLI